MKEQLFSVSAEHKRTGEKIELYVWAQNVYDATHLISNVLFGADGEYRWLGSGPECDENGDVILRER